MIKPIWTQERVEVLTAWYPVLGKNYVAEQLQLTARQVKTKADKLKLVLLPKEQRLCVECKRNHQVTRKLGLLCIQCHSEKRKNKRRSESKPLHTRFAEMLRSARHRNNCTLTVQDLETMWLKQKGLCFYSGITMTFERWGTSSNMSTRSPYVPSLDRVDSNKGYTMENVVLCCWAVNVGKNNFPLQTYLDVCKEVAKKNHADILAELANELP